MYLFRDVVVNPEHEHPPHIKHGSMMLTLHSFYQFAFTYLTPNHFAGKKQTTNCRNAGTQHTAAAATVPDDGHCNYIPPSPVFLGRETLANSNINGCFPIPYALLNWVVWVEASYLNGGCEGEAHKSLEQGTRPGLEVSRDAQTLSAQSLSAHAQTHGTQGLCF